MYVNIFDSHAHYDDGRFDPDRDQVIASLPLEGIVGVVNAASDLDSSWAGIRLARRWPFFHCGVGVHPQQSAEAPADYLDQLRRLARDPAVCAIGEIGLDYYYDYSPKEIQLRRFEEQLHLARELNLPVIIHDRDAHGDTLDLLRRLRPAGVVHCFSGSAQMAREVVELGMYVGFTGVVTFKNARRALEAAAQVPLDRLLIETDCPYMAPEPHRGRRCDSSPLPYPTQARAQGHGTPVQELLNHTCENARRLFALD